MKQNFKSVCILSTLYKQSMFKQIISLFKHIFSKAPVYFRYTLVLNNVLLEQWANAIDKSTVLGGLLTNFSTILDSINYERLITRLNVYGVTLLTLI